MIKKYFCDKCQTEFKFDEMNENEQEEYIENNGFVCSTCINEEMEKENKYALCVCCQNSFLEEELNDGKCEGCLFQDRE